MTYRDVQTSSLHVLQGRLYRMTYRDVQTSSLHVLQGRLYRMTNREYLFLSHN